jgi:hypothetical protein
MLRLIIIKIRGKDTVGILSGILGLGKSSVFSAPSYYTGIYCMTRLFKHYSTFLTLV